jgi:glycosyltransferase involved in cell wall biosynthesis
MTLTISVCIPCVIQHVPTLDRCIKSISEQIVLPKEVVISVSSVEEGQMDATKTATEFLLGKYRNKLEINVLYTTEKRYAGENRNIAIRHATGDIISFIDADDTMYPNRLYAIRNIFELYPDCIGVVHHFTENGCRNTDRWRFNEDFVDSYVYSTDIHFGHPTFRREVFDVYQYSALPRCQDMQLLNEILQKHIDKILIYKRKLTNYNSKDSVYFSLSAEEKKIHRI